MTKYYCDLCGKELKSNQQKHTYIEYYNSVGQQRIDLWTCKECRNTLIEEIKDLISKTKEKNTTPKKEIPKQGFFASLFFGKERNSAKKNPKKPIPPNPR